MPRSQPLILALMLSLSLVLVSLAACVNAWRHSPTQAGSAATSWAKMALVDREMDQAYGQMAEEFKSTYPLGEVSRAITEMHPEGWPDSVFASEYEPTPGQKGMNIFLVGHSEAQDFYYRFWMAGTADDGYQVAGVFRGSGPYPPSEAREPLD